MASAPQPSYDIIGAIKIKDGLFLGDELAAQDLEFVVANKVTHVINCSSRQVPNHWEAIGVRYLSYYWADNDSQVILDVRDSASNEFYTFIEDALEKGESTLVHSVRGQSRSITVIAAYMIRKFKWSLAKTLQFLSNRRPDIVIKPAFHRQLIGFERRVAASMCLSDGRLAVGADFSKHNIRPTGLSTDWALSSGASMDTEDVLLRNTFVNSQQIPVNYESSDRQRGSSMHRRLQWTDNGSGDRCKLETPASLKSGSVRPIKPIIKRSTSGPAAVPIAAQQPLHTRPSSAGGPAPAVLAHTRSPSVPRDSLTASTPVSQPRNQSPTLSYIRAPSPTASSFSPTRNLPLHCANLRPPGVRKQRQTATPLRFHNRPTDSLRSSSSPVSPPSPSWARSGPIRVEGRSACDRTCSCRARRCTRRGSRSTGPRRFPTE